uniref:Uncharacterized protein n=1 Tax=Corethron hystrix TaxID=216773 RepID=A0A7S1BMX1_9STRA|mmetsp:Transcript_34530/g.79835  ORF Transcript_34530/g.79835 Transcript_34530/m.79835 type:complete len:383 (+) Transcript_34530:87-1235(+)
MTADPPIKMAVPWCRLLFPMLCLSFARDSVGMTIDSTEIKTNKDHTPTLGRGYSFATGMFYSKCISVGELTETTMDYKYNLHEFNFAISFEYESKLQKDTERSSGAQQAITSLSQQTNTGGNFNKSFIWAIMELDKYYTSIDESSVSFDPNVQAMMDRNDLIGVLASCGPMFTRAMRRNSELFAQFEFKSTSASVRKSFSYKMVDNIGGGGEKESLTRGRMSAYAQHSKLKITIKGFGLDLGAKNVRSLIVVDLENFGVVMDAAFQTLSNPTVGQISSVEVIPWMSLPSFQGSLVAFDHTSTKIVEVSGPPVTRVETVIPPMLKQAYFLANAQFLTKINNLNSIREKMVFQLSSCQRVLWTMNPSTLCHRAVIEKKRSSYKS